mgnify:CR=1 FL=1
MDRLYQSNRVIKKKKEDLFESVNELAVMTFRLTLSVLLVQLWGSYLLLRIKEQLTIRNLGDATESIRSLMIVSLAIVLAFWISGVTPVTVGGGVNFSKHI